MVLWPWTFMIGVYCIKSFNWGWQHYSLYMSLSSHALYFSFCHPSNATFDTFDGLQKKTPWQNVFHGWFPHGFSLNISLPVTRGSSSGAAWREAGGWILAMTHGTLSVLSTTFNETSIPNRFKHGRRWRNTMKCNFVPLVDWECRKF